jgi:hypothetical protein
MNFQAVSAKAIVLACGARPYAPRTIIATSRVKTDPKARKSPKQPRIQNGRISPFRLIKNKEANKFFMQKTVLWGLGKQGSFIP